MVYDCFTFYNELDLLEIRLNELNKVVDFFVIVESTYTFSGEKKPLYYLKNKARYKKFTKKIIHIVVKNLDNPPIITNKPPYSSNPIVQVNSQYWNREFYQRNCILRGLKKANKNDLILIGDVDEIPKPSILNKIKSSKKPHLFQMDTYYYYLNCKSSQIDNCTRAIYFKNLIKTTPQEIRWLQPNYCKVHKHSGWHFSYVGAPNNITNKIKSFSHQEYNTSKFNNPENIKFNIDNNLDLFHRSIGYKIIKINNKFPDYLQINHPKYSHLIKKPTRTSKNTILLRKAITENRLHIIQQEQLIDQLKNKESELYKIKNSKFYKLWQKYLRLKEIFIK